MITIKDTHHPNVEIAVCNFGPITEATIDLRPLTVFIGPSNTGKTYLATQIYALHGIFNGFSESGFLSPFGPTGFIGLMADNNPEGGTLLNPVISDEEGKGLIEKLMTDKMGDREPLKLSDLPTSMQNQLQDIIKKSEVFRGSLQDELKNCFDLNSILALIRLAEEQQNEMTVSLKVSAGNQECWKINLKVSKLGTTVDKSISKNMILLPEGWSISINWSVSEKGPRVSFKHPLPNSIERNRYYLPAARSGIAEPPGFSQLSCKTHYSSRFGTFPGGANLVRGDSGIHATYHPLRGRQSIQWRNARHCRHLRI